MHSKKYGIVGLLVGFIIGWFLSYIGLPLVTVDDSFYSESYRLVSVFMNAVYLAGLNGEILTDRNSVNSIGLPNLLADYLHLLEDGYDVFTQDLEHNVIDLRAHRFDEPLPVSSNLYYLIEWKSNFKV